MSTNDEHFCCPTCGRELSIDVLDLRSVGARVTRCPYPICSSIVVALTSWHETRPTELYSPAQVAETFRYRFVDDAPVFLFAQGILALAIIASCYAVSHVANATATTTTQSLAHLGIVTGAIGLGVPASIVAIVLARMMIERIRDDRYTLKRVKLGLPVEPDRLCDPGFRLSPNRDTYRG